jgi:cellulose biosynthesis protein BcsQ
MAVLFPNAWFGRYQTFLCTGRNYGTSTYSVVYLVCISDRRAAFTGHSDLVRRFQPANPIFGQIYENVYPDRRTESLLPKWDCVGKYSFHGSCLYECDAVCRRYVLKKQIFAVCDLEAEYACNFMDYLNQKKNIPFEIQAFTSVESLVAYVKKNPVELLLISSEAMCREVGELDIGKIVILTEGSKPKELEKYTGVYKYQASSDVVREVMACYGAEKAILPAQLPVLKKTTEILGVYSPLGGCLQTCFALTLAQILGREKSVLYLNLEEYAGFEELMHKKFLHTLSDLLYFVKQGSTGIAVKMNGMAESMGNVDFIPPVQSPEDIRGTSWQDWEHLLQEIILHSSYETIVLDIGNGIEEVFQMLDMCTTVYTPIKTDKMSRSKLAQFEELLSVRDYPQILSRMVKLNLPYGQEVLAEPFRAEQLIWGTLGDFVRELLGKDEV